MFRVSQLLCCRTSKLWVFLRRADVFAGRRPASSGRTEQPTRQRTTTKTRRTRMTTSKTTTMTPEKYKGQRRNVGGCVVQKARRATLYDTVHRTAVTAQIHEIHCVKICWHKDSNKKKKNKKLCLENEANHCWNGASVTKFLPSQHIYCICFFSDMQPLVSYSLGLGERLASRVCL